MGNLAIKTIEGGVVFTVKVIPSSSQTAAKGVFDGMLKVKVSAVAEKGKANQCLIEFLAKQLGIKKGAIKIISGQTNPVKILEVFGVTADMVVEKFGL